MPTYQLRGVDVDFPHDAYPCQVWELSVNPCNNFSVVLSEKLTGVFLQLAFMEKVIQALQEVNPLEPAPFFYPSNIFSHAQTVCAIALLLAMQLPSKFPRSKTGDMRSCCCVSSFFSICSPTSRIDPHTTTLFWELHSGCSRDILGLPAFTPEHFFRCLRLSAGASNHDRPCWLTGLERAP